MSWILWIPKILDFLVAIPQLVGVVESAVGAVTYWYIARQRRETLAEIADAAAFAARAETDQERYEAAQKWRAVLSRPRIDP